MSDVHTKKQRSYNMSRIKNKDTRPEIVVRKIIHGMGYRYGLHRKDLPGKPDIVLTRHRKIIQINGCFWHKHNCKYGKVKPKTNADFWEMKRTATVKRDKESLSKLKKLGWDILVIWECQTKQPKKIVQKLTAFLNPSMKS
ncbi:MAG: DNA mismatch endonuclease Vsr [Anaerohalosphaeraceae bacterium]|nr:DNA mismatch endonuclease Vsr [Anaerohalosphaeraceae bacterium]